MTPDVQGDPLKSAHQKILEQKYVMTNHVVDVLSLCHRIMAIESVRNARNCGLN